MQGVASALRLGGVRVEEPRGAGDEELARVHGREYLTLLRETAGRTVTLDPDTVASPASYGVARLAAGAALSAVDHVLDAPRGARGLAMVRPPGHHAERNRAMGFCLFNNAAIAAAHARARGLSRVAVVDYDVHHGNGTQWSFYDDPSVLVISSHQFPFYPGTGAAADVGAGAGAGFTANFPLEAGAAGADYDMVYATGVVPILEQFRPEFIVISAGFDAHEDDPLGGMRLTSSDFGRLTAMVASVADEYCDGRVVAVTEGGYDLDALAASLLAVAGALDGDAPLDPPTPRGDACPRGRASVDAARAHLRRHWTL